MIGKLLLRASAWLTAAVLLLCTVPAVPAEAAPLTYNVPRVMITTEEGSGTALVKDDGYVNAQITVYGTDGSIISDTGRIKVRGNSTAKAKKKPYTIKFDTKQDIEGMGAAKKWVLLANAFDPTFLRNDAIFTLAEQLGLAYTPDHCFATLSLDGTPLGCYEIVEPVDVHKNRVELDVSAGDFLLQYERSRVEEDATYITLVKRKTMRFEVKEPEAPDEEQLAEIQTYMDSIVNTMKKKKYNDLAQMIDIPSFAKLYVLNEFAKNVDFGFSSVYFYRKDGKLYAGPVWDYDLSLGNPSDWVIHSYANFMYPEGIIETKAQFYYYLMPIPEFAEEVRRTYCENWQLFHDFCQPGGYLDQQYAMYQNVFAENFKIWRINKRYGFYMRLPDATYEENLRFLQSWSAAREAWLSEYYGAAEYGRPLTGDVDANGAVEMADAVLLTQIITEQTDAYPDDLEMRADLDYNWVFSAADLRALLLILTPPKPPEEVEEPEEENPPETENPGSGAEIGSGYGSEFGSYEGSYVGSTE